MLLKTTSEPLLRVEGLSKNFNVAGSWPWQRRKLSAVNDISFEIAAGETLSLVGESGCGKSTAGRMLVGLSTPSTGRIQFEGQDIGGMSAAERRAVRRRIQLIFQDPYGSLNPRMTVGELIAEPALLHGLVDRGGARDRVAELLNLVGLGDRHAGRYPHEFSGGQRQRIGIARALAVEPQLIVCDEPVSALDVSVQAQIVNLLQSLQDRLGLSYLFISHGLSVVRHISNRVAVMYLGNIVEIGPKTAIFDRPLHPYTRALLAAAPVARPGARRAGTPLTGDMPSPLAPPAGCRFHPRCPLAVERCKREVPVLSHAEGGRLVACHRWQEIPAFQANASAAQHSPATKRLLALYRDAATRSNSHTNAV
ncbi:peptide ABC transporter substrate-binding protein [Sinorhizobium sp. A49]|uniref:ABC transporter ATP-binding protein n=1 Tax=Sinorhizobium sp. A49 TaxID=1945861 RepID=UPI0009855E19|nr:dipeptide ABC transporter ATP-binding protein [Sinorhizobium sp. A49]OOG65299.1 peptide ABC transporter substrate-binding protein [Sinorhizobium sp. A49]